MLQKNNVTARYFFASDDAGSLGRRWEPQTTLGASDDARKPQTAPGSLRRLWKPQNDVGNLSRL
jgi:hypothetical protein